jgi:hypothetical protein
MKMKYYHLEAKYEISKRKVTILKRKIKWR